MFLVCNLAKVSFWRPQVLLIRIRCVQVVMQGFYCLQLQKHRPSQNQSSAPNVRKSRPTQDLSGAVAATKNMLMNKNDNINHLNVDTVRKSHPTRVTNCVERVIEKPFALNKESTTSNINTIKSKKN